MLLALAIATQVIGIDGDLWTRLKPAADLRLRWNERFESGHSRSTPLLRGHVGVFPTFTPNLSAGVQISTRTPSSEEIAFDNATGSRSLGISQAFIEIQNANINHINLILGKFALPTQHSPVLFDPDFKPEGAFESFQLSLNPSLKAEIFAGQYSLVQVEESRFDGISKDRAWRLLQGILAEWKFDPDSLLSLSFTAAFDQQTSGTLTDLSAQRGNRFTGTVGTSAKLSSRFFPMETLLQLEGRPLGIRSLLSGAFIWNPRSSDNQRALWIQAEMGNLWKAGNLAATIDYLYAEPDVALAAVSDSNHGFLNRAGTKMEVQYFPLEYWRLAASYLFADVIANSVYQGRRHDIFLETELRF